MEEIKRIGRELKYHGVVVDVYADTMEMPDGHTAIWDYVHHNGAAAVLPVLEDGRILLVKQYRNAVNRETLEIPAGKLDFPGEKKIDCAYRELEEETGYRTEHLEFLLRVTTTIAICNEEIDVYLADHLVPTSQHLDEDEFIDVGAYELDDLCRRIYAGEISDSKTVAAILAYQGKVRSGK